MAMPTKRRRSWTVERSERAAAMYLAGASLCEIGAELGSTATRVSSAIRSVGGVIRPRGAPGDRNGSWRGGRKIDADGYVLLLIPGHPHSNAKGYVREHRLVVEKALGRYLAPTEVVHHKNGDRSDNRPENLERFASNGEHLAHELRGRCPKWSDDGKRRLREAVQARRRR